MDFRTDAWTRLLRTLAVTGSLRFKCDQYHTMYDDHRGVLTHTLTAPIKQPRVAILVQTLTNLDIPAHTPTECTPCAQMSSSLH